MKYNQPISILPQFADIPAGKRTEHEQISTKSYNKQSISIKGNEDFEDKEDIKQNLE